MNRNDSFLEILSENQIITETTERVIDAKKQDNLDSLCGLVDAECTPWSLKEKRKFLQQLSSPEKLHEKSAQENDVCLNTLVSYQTTDEESDLENNCNATNIMKRKEKRNSSIEEVEKMDYENIWTLKYTTINQENHLRELTKGSNIFIKSSALNNAKRTCQMQTTLARSLLELVFKESALSVCSLRGKQANGLGSTEERRPGLNQDGVNTIISYVGLHAKRENWKAVDERIVVKSLCARLFEIREKKLKAKKT